MSEAFKKGKELEEYISIVPRQARTVISAEKEEASSKHSIEKSIEGADS